MVELTIVASAVRALLELAVSRGARREALLARARVDPAELADSDGRVAFGKYVALMHAGQALCGDPALALHFGEAVDVSEVSIGCTIGGATTLDEGFAMINRFSRLGVEVEGVENGERFALARRAGRLWIVDTRANPNAFPELTESTFARMVCSARRRAGESAIFTEIHVTHPAPSYRAEYERIFRAPVVFRSGENALVVDERVLARHGLPPSSRYVAEVLRGHAESMLAKLDASRTTRARVESLLRPALRRGDASVGAVSRRLGVSRQTLFRRLKAEGVTYERLLDELRRRMALHYLGVPRTSVAETARLLGYGDAASFARAFKRWTGHRPRAHRHAPYTS
jgi:AraC-like DNA-binding protein